MFTPTTEQVEIAKAVSRGEDIKVIAGPGTGKSSTLRYICQENKYKNFLSITFNKANAVEAENHPERPPNVEYKTSHSLAYRQIVDYKMRKKLNYGLMYQDVPTELARQMIQQYHQSIEGSKKQTQDVQREVIMLTTAFCNSGAYDITSFLKELPKEFFYITLDEYQEASFNDWLILVSRYWDLLVNKDSPTKISHDVYLKLFQLGRFQIQGYDAILVDEFQDTNPCFVEILRTNKQLQQIFVGDPAQSLYAFRGARNCFSDFNYNTYYLSTSFRFSEEIAVYINKVQPYTPSPLIVAGASTRDEIQTQAYIARTNAGCFSIIAQQLKENPSLLFYTPSDMKETFSKLFHLQACFFDEKPKFPDKQLLHIHDRKSLDEAVDYSDDIYRLQKLGEALRDSFKTLGAANTLFKEQLVSSPLEANFTVSTIHKFKGLEADVVTVADDFISFKKENYTDKDEDEMDFEDMEVELSPQEMADAVKAELLEKPELANLLYVAVSRPRVKLQLPNYLEAFFTHF